MITLSTTLLTQLETLRATFQSVADAAGTGDGVSWQMPANFSGSPADWEGLVAAYTASELVSQIKSMIYGGQDGTANDLAMGVLQTDMLNAMLQASFVRYGMTPCRSAAQHQATAAGLADTNGPLYSTIVDALQNLETAGSQ